MTQTLTLTQKKHRQLSVVLNNKNKNEKTLQTTNHLPPDDSGR